VKRGSLPDRSKENLSSLKNLGFTKTPLNGAQVTPIPGIKWRSVKITPDPPEAPRLRMHVAPISAIQGGTLRKLLRDYFIGSFNSIFYLKFNSVKVTYL